MMNPKTATIGEIQNTIQIRAHLEYLKRILPKETALELAKRIRPVMSMDENGKFSVATTPNDSKYWVDGCKIFNQSYTFKAGETVYEKAEQLTQIATIKTYHTCGHPLLLKPSVYEVLYQIPAELLDKVVAFELYAPELSAYDLYDDNLERHVLTCVLYTGNIPQSVKEKTIEW